MKIKYCYSVIVMSFLFISSTLTGQVDTCISPVLKHEIYSEHLQEQREFWVSLPLRYDSLKTYPVLYLFDAEWRVDLVGRIVYDLGGNKRIPDHIVVGIPHVDWRMQRGIDLTFSQSRNEYDGTTVDSTVYNASNSGGGARFFKYLTTELLQIVEKHYSTNGENILVGHSYGGYFASYILGKAHPFTAFHIYDPSIWFSEREAIQSIRDNLSKDRKLKVFISYQPVPKYHAAKIEAMIDTLSTYENVELGYKLYEDETHNSLYLPSFLEGIRFLYPRK